MPENFTYGYVVATLITSRGDASDEDRLPDVVGATQIKVVFTRLQSQYVHLSPPRIISTDKISCAVMPDGNITSDVDDKGNAVPGAVPGVWLVTGRYKVSFGGHAPDQTIDVLPEHTLESPLNLALTADYTPPPGGTTQTINVPPSGFPGQWLGMTVTGLGWVAGIVVLGAEDPLPVDPPLPDGTLVFRTA